MYIYVTRILNKLEDNNSTRFSVHTSKGQTFWKSQDTSQRKIILLKAIGSFQPFELKIGRRIA